MVAHVELSFLKSCCLWFTNKGNYGLLLYSCEALSEVSVLAMLDERWLELDPYTFTGELLSELGYYFARYSIVHRSMLVSVHRNSALYSCDRWSVVNWSSWNYVIWYVCVSSSNEVVYIMMIQPASIICAMLPKHYQWNNKISLFFFLPWDYLVYIIVVCTVCCCTFILNEIIALFSGLYMVGCDVISISKTNYSVFYKLLYAFWN